MAVRKGKKATGTPEDCSGPSKVVPEKALSTNEIVAKYLKGDLTIKRRGLYDPPELGDIPPSRKIGASIPKVADEARNVLISDAILRDQKEKATKKAEKPVKAPKEEAKASEDKSGSE